MPTMVRTEKVLSNLRATRSFACRTLAESNGRSGFSQIIPMGRKRAEIAICWRRPPFTSMMIGLSGWMQTRIISQAVIDFKATRATTDET